MLLLWSLLRTFRRTFRIFSRGRRTSLAKGSIGLAAHSIQEGIVRSPAVDSTLVGIVRSLVVGSIQAGIVQEGIASIGHLLDLQDNSLAAGSIQEDTLPQRTVAADPACIDDIAVAIADIVDTADAKMEFELVDVLAFVAFAVLVEFAAAESV